MAMNGIGGPGMDPEQLRLQMGLSKEEMIKRFGHPQPQQPQQNFMQQGFQQFYQPQGGQSAPQRPIDPSTIPQGMPPQQQQQQPQGMPLQQQQQPPQGLQAPQQLQGFPQGAQQPPYAQPPHDVHPQQGSLPPGMVYDGAKPQSPESMPGKKEVHHDDKQWLRDFHRQHPDASKKDARRAFEAQFERKPV